MIAVAHPAAVDVHPAAARHPAAEPIREEADNNVNARVRAKEIYIKF